MELDVNNHSSTTHPDEHEMSWHASRFYRWLKQQRVHAALSFRENVIPQGNRVQAEKRALWCGRKMLKYEAYRQDYVEFVWKILFLVYQITVHLLEVISSPYVANDALIRAVCASSMAGVCVVWECKTPSFLKIFAHLLQEHSSPLNSDELDTLSRLWPHWTPDHLLPSVAIFRTRSHWSLTKGQRCCIHSTP